MIHLDENFSVSSFKTSFYSFGTWNLFNWFHFKILIFLLNKVRGEIFWSVGLFYLLHLQHLWFPKIVATSSCSEQIISSHQLHQIQYFRFKYFSTKPVFFTFHVQQFILVLLLQREKESCGENILCLNLSLITGEVYFKISVLRSTAQQPLNVES